MFHRASGLAFGNVLLSSSLAAKPNTGLHRMKKIYNELNRFWDEDKSLTVTFVLLSLFIFVFVPTLSGGRAGEIFIKVVYTTMLLTGILSVAKNKTLVVAISLFAFVSVFVSWLSRVNPSKSILIANDLSIILFTFFFATAILIKTFQPGDITFHRIIGSIVVYLSVGMIFASTFRVIYLLHGPVSFNGLQEGNLKEFLYFSFTTLTTVGYGDITPVHPLARSFANCESLVGQLYPAILIARLVSMEFDHTNRKKGKG